MSFCAMATVNAAALDYELATIWSGTHCIALYERDRLLPLSETALNFSFGTKNEFTYIYWVFETT